MSGQEKHVFLQQLTKSCVLCVELVDVNVLTGGKAVLAGITLEDHLLVEATGGGGGRAKDVLVQR